jgi:hypothetical protein
MLRSSISSSETVTLLMSRLGSRFCRIEDGVLTGIFIVALCLPALGMVFHLGVMTPEQENRRLTPFPALSRKPADLLAFPAKFGDYFKDHFGFRQTLIRWQAIAQVKVFGVSTSPSVILGKDGWLFLAGDDSDKGEQLRRPFTQNQLEYWRKVLESRRDWLAQRNIRYIFTITPSKQTIYPEYMPDTFKRGEQTRLDQLIKYLKEHSDVEILDLRPTLLQAKTRRQIYYKYDTHWNFYGAFAGYRLIAETAAKSFPAIHPSAESDCDLTIGSYSAGDLTKLLGVSGTMTEPSPALKLKHTSYKEVFNEPTLTTKFGMSISEQSDGKLPRLVMFHNSASLFIIPFLSQHFSRAVYAFGNDFSRELIEAEHPDIVIQESAEMHLLLGPPVDLPTDPPQIKELYARALHLPPPAKESTEIPAGSINGYLDAANCNGITGWAWDRLRPDARIDVEIRDGETLLAKVPADVYRNDLEKAGIGDGKHSFYVPLPSSLKNDAPHLIYVRIAGTKTDLHATPQGLFCSAQ